MKGLLVFLLGAAVGAGVVWFYAVPERTRAEQAARSDVVRGVEQARESIESGARKAADAINARLDAWDLEPKDIEEDLRRTGRVIRRKAREWGSDASDAALTAAIEAKLAADADLSARKIDVRTEGGRVVLEGSVATPDHVAKAVRLALETEGVKEVDASLRVEGVPSPAGDDRPEASASPGASPGGDAPATR